MYQISYLQVRKAIEQWIIDNRTNFADKNILLEEVEKTPEQLYIILNFQKCLAAMVVSENVFTPYRWVSFEVGDIVDGVHKMIYSWYDNENTTIKEIINNLDKSVEIALDYNNKIS